MKFFNDSRLRACELLREAAQNVCEGMELPDAPKDRAASGLVVAEIMSCLRHTRDLNVEAEPSEAKMIVDITSVRDLMRLAQTILDPYWRGVKPIHERQLESMELVDSVLQQSRDDLTDIIRELERAFQEKQR